MDDNKRKKQVPSTRIASNGQKAKPRGKNTTRRAPSKERKGISGVPGSKNPERRCHATANKTGEQCKRAAIKGGTVCPIHGGSTPKVREKARERLLALVDPALAALQAVLTDPKADDSTKVRAALGILDRTGHGPGAKIEIGGPNAFDQVALEALQMDRDMGENPKQVGASKHTWEDMDQFSKDAQGQAWAELEQADDSDLKPHETFTGPVVRGEVVPTMSDDILPDYAKQHERDPSEMSGGVSQPNGRRTDDPPAYWPDEDWRE